MAEIRGFFSTCRFNPAMRKQTSIFKSLSQKHDFWHCVRFVQPCHCDSARRHLCHLTKRCVCHEMTMCQRKALCLPRENDAIIMKSSAPATQNAKSYRQCMHVILSPLCERRPLARLCGWLRTLFYATLSERGSNLQTSRVFTREPFPRHSTKGITRLIFRECTQKKRFWYAVYSL